MLYKQAHWLRSFSGVVVRRAWFSSNATHTALACCFDASDASDATAKTQG